jgi:hypothetical protein
MTDESTKATVLATQRGWALQAGLHPDARGYVGAVSDNLRVPMSERARAAFDDADGGEMLDADGKPAKMRALHSSSALAINVFAYWEDRSDLTPLLSAMSVDAGAGTLEFERKLPTGARRGKPPNVDVVISTTTGLLVGVESKFTEWMTPKLALGKSLAPYIDGAESYWSRVGMAAAHSIALDVHRGTAKYRYLDVPQLLKHCLGLARASGPGRWLLRYVYFGATGGDIPTEHAKEIARFAERVQPDVDFSAVSYQALAASLARDDTIDPAYLTYLRERYGL